MVESLFDGNINFFNEHRLTDENTQFFKSDGRIKGVVAKSEASSKEQERDRIWLKVTDQYAVSDQILVGFIDDATDDLEPRYDAEYYNYHKGVNLYTVVEDSKLVIQGLGAFDSNKTVDMGFDAQYTADLSFSISKTEGALTDAQIFLVDNYLNIRHDLKASDYYVNNVEVGQYSDRFTLEFVSAVSDDIAQVEEGEFFKVGTEYEMLKINSSKNVQDIKVYDVLGRMIIHKAPMQSSFQLNTEGVKDGSILFIEAQLEDGSMVNKKSIKY